MFQFSWKVFNNAQRPASGDVPSGSHPREEERADANESEEDGSDDIDGIFNMIGELATRIGNIRRAQRQIVTKQCQQAEEFRRHQDRVEDFIKYQVAFNAYMASGKTTTHCRTHCLRRITHNREGSSQFSLLIILASFDAN